MTKKQAFRNSVIYLVLIALGFFIAFKVWWEPGAARFLGIIAFVLIFGGLLFLSSSLTRLFVPAKVDFDFSTLRDKTVYQSFRKNAGAVIARKASLTFSLLFLLLGGTSVYSFIRFINGYEEKQLKKYGVTQKVRIKDIDRKGKGSEYAAFDYYFDNKIYSNDLEQKDFAIGDSVEIIFSAEDPDILEWAVDFKRESD